MYDLVRLLVHLIAVDHQLTILFDKVCNERLQWHTSVPESQEAPSQGSRQFETQKSHQVTQKNVKIMSGFRGSGQVTRPNPWSKNLCLPVTIWTLEVLCLCKTSVIHWVHPVVLGVFHSALSSLHFSLFYLPLQFICPTLTLFRAWSPQFSVAPTGMAMEGRCKFQPPARVKISVRGTNITMYHTEKYDNDTVYIDVHKYQAKHFILLSKANHSHDGKGWKEYCGQTNSSSEGHYCLDFHPSSLGHESGLAQHDSMVEQWSNGSSSVEMLKAVRARLNTCLFFLRISWIYFQQNSPECTGTQSSNTFPYLSQRCWCLNKRARLCMIQLVQSWVELLSR